MNQNIYYVVKINDDGNFEYLGTISSYTRHSFFENRNLALEFDNKEAAQAVADWMYRNGEQDVYVAKMTYTINVL